MFGIGMGELLLILGLALIVVGPEKMPGLARSLAKQVMELKKMASALQESIQAEDKGEDRPWEKYVPEEIKRENKKHSGELVTDFDFIDQDAAPPDAQPEQPAAPPADKTGDPATADPDPHAGKKGDS